MTGDRLRVNWLKSSHSDSSDSSDGNDCVEVAAAQAGVHVRDSKDTRLPHLAVAPAAWARFVAHASGR